MESETRQGNEAESRIKYKEEEEQIELGLELNQRIEVFRHNLTVSDLNRGTAFAYFFDLFWFHRVFMLFSL